MTKICCILTILLLSLLSAFQYLVWQNGDIAWSRSQDNAVLLPSQIESGSAHTLVSQSVSKQFHQGILRDNLHRDFEIYSPGKSVHSIWSQAQHLWRTKRAGCIGLVVIYNQHVQVYQHGPGPRFCQSRVDWLQRGILAGIQRFNLTFPNSLFIFNAYDEPSCGKLPQGCQVPVFSLMKRWDFASNKTVDQDVLLPHFGRDWSKSYNYPWNLKLNKAMMRGSIQESMTKQSVRWQLADLANTHSTAAQLMDVKITQAPGAWQLAGPVKGEAVPMEDHPRWRYLISTDGHTASGRLAALMSTNSVVLKQESHWIEYYYRSLREGQHYLGFNLATIIPLVKSLQAGSGIYTYDKQQEIAMAAQAFVHSCLNHYAKAIYVQQALLRFNLLFNNMDTVLDKLMKGGQLKDLSLRDIQIALQA